MTTPVKDYVFEEDTRVAFRSILQLSSNYRILQERCDSQEQTIKELKLELEKIKNPGKQIPNSYLNQYKSTTDSSKEKISVNKIDISYNLLSKETTTDSKEKADNSSRGSETTNNKNMNVDVYDISNSQLNKLSKKYMKMNVEDTLKNYNFITK
jgi:hypothetical protein